MQLFTRQRLLNNISSGTTFKMGMSLGYSTVRNNSKVFKSRILDVDASNPDSDGTLSVILADELPSHPYANSGFRHYGFMYVNYGGWTYPSTGGSSFRPNNAQLGSSAPRSNYQIDLVRFNLVIRLDILGKMILPRQNPLKLNLSLVKLLLSLDWMLMVMLYAHYHII